MSGVNKVILIGRVGKDPELRNLQSGQSVANFSMATSESWKDKTTGEKKETTTWHSIVLWGNLAEIAGKYVHKGDLLYIEGKITTETYEKDGITRYVTKIVANTMTMLGSKSQSSQGADKPPVPQGKADGFDELPKTDVTDDSELPF